MAITYSKIHKTTDIGHTNTTIRNISDFDFGIIEWQFCGQNPRRMARLVQANRKAFIAQIITLYNCGGWKSISKHSTS